MALDLGALHNIQSNRGALVLDQKQPDQVKVIGNAVKVSALDPVSNIEVCVVGSAHASPYSLKMNALRKLKAALRKNAAQ